MLQLRRQVKREQAREDQPRRMTGLTSQMASMTSNPGPQSAAPPELVVDVDRSAACTQHSDGGWAMAFFPTWQVMRCSVLVGQPRLLSTLQIDHSDLGMRTI